MAGIASHLELIHLLMLTGIAMALRRPYVVTLHHASASLCECNAAGLCSGLLICLCRQKMMRHQRIAKLRLSNGMLPIFAPGSLSHTLLCLHPRLHGTSLL